MLTFCLNNYIFSAIYDLKKIIFFPPLKRIIFLSSSMKRIRYGNFYGRKIIIFVPTKLKEFVMLIYTPCKINSLPLSPIAVITSLYHASIPE